MVATLAVMLPTAPVAVAKSLTPDHSNTPEPGGIAKSSCDLDASARRIAGLPRGTVFAPLDIGPSILLQTDHDVIATGHHRADKAMRDVIATFVSPPDVTGRRSVEFQERFGIELTRVGHVEDGTGVEVLGEGDGLDGVSGGFDHFSSDRSC